MDSRKAMTNREQITSYCGRTWSTSRISNLPMATSKPVAGTFNTGQRLLICTTAKNNGGWRSPLTIPVTAPRENLSQEVFVIRRSVHPDEPGESADSPSLSYPCAIEHDGHLYVGYSNNGGRRGNLNSAELAIIPIEQFELDRDPWNGFAFRRHLETKRPLLFDNNPPQHET